jgi:hypothetical protein
VAVPALARGGRGGADPVVAELVVLAAVALAGELAVVRTW